MPNNSKTFDPIEVLTNTLSDEHNLTYFLIILLLVLIFCHIYKFVSKCRKKRTTSMAYIKLRCYTSGSTQNITLASLPTEIRFISSSKICPPMGYTRINSCGTITLRPNWVTPLILCLTAGFLYIPQWCWGIPLASWSMFVGEIGGLLQKTPVGRKTPHRR